MVYLHHDNPLAPPTGGVNWIGTCKAGHKCHRFCVQPSKTHNFLFLFNVVLVRNPTPSFLQVFLTRKWTLSYSIGSYSSNIIQSSRQKFYNQLNWCKQIISNNLEITIVRQFHTVSLQHDFLIQDRLFWNYYLSPGKRQNHAVHHCCHT